VFLAEQQLVADLLLSTSVELRYSGVWHTMNFTLKACFYVMLISPDSQSFSAEAPLRALPSHTVYDFLSEQHSKLCYSISDITDCCHSQTLACGYRPISLPVMTRVAVTHNLQLESSHL